MNLLSTLYSLEEQELHINTLLADPHIHRIYQSSKRAPQITTVDLTSLGLKDPNEVYRAQRAIEQMTFALEGIFYIDDFDDSQRRKTWVNNWEDSSLRAFYRSTSALRGNNVGQIPSGVYSFARALRRQRELEGKEIQTPLEQELHHVVSPDLLNSLYGTKEEQREKIVHEFHDVVYNLLENIQKKAR